MSEDKLSVDVPLDRDRFLRVLVRELSGTLQDVVGLDEAAGFVSIVGQHVGEWIDNEYAEQLGETWSREQVAEVLVDLKRRIQGDFYVTSIDESKIVLRNRACPFGSAVEGRPSMCMMTSNVFGYIASTRLGYARVTLEETIASGADGCSVVVHLRRGKGPVEPNEREYFGSGRDRDGP